MIGRTALELEQIYKIYNFSESSRGGGKTVSGGHPGLKVEGTDRVRLLQPGYHVRMPDRRPEPPVFVEAEVAARLAAIDRAGFGEYRLAPMAPPPKAKRRTPRDDDTK